MLDGEALALVASTADVLLAVVVGWDGAGVGVGDAEGDADDVSGLGTGVSVKGTVLSAVTFVVALVNAAEFVCVLVDGRYAAYAATAAPVITRHTLSAPSTPAATETRVECLPLRVLRP